MQDRLIKRHYIALAKGRLISGATIDAAIGRHPSKRTLMAVCASGKPAITHYRVRQRFGHFTLLDVHLDTGRTHQIRVHFQSIRHSLVGDKTYGYRLALPPNCSPTLANQLRTVTHQALHAYCLSFVHPIVKDTVSVQAPIPQWLDTLIACLAQYDPPI